jgi:hypothetical protein
MKASLSCYWIPVEELRIYFLFHSTNFLVKKFFIKEFSFYPILLNAIDFDFLLLKNQFYQSYFYYSILIKSSKAFNFFGVFKSHLDYLGCFFHYFFKASFN